MEKGHFSVDERWPPVITAGTAENFKLKEKKKKPSSDMKTRKVPTSGFNKQTGGLVNVDIKKRHIMSSKFRTTKSILTSKAAVR